MNWPAAVCRMGRQQARKGVHARSVGLLRGATEMIDPERARATHEPLRGPFLNVDLAALKTLKLVHELSSLSLAARQLDVDQSSVSYTLKRLRTVFDDPLFVRGKNGIVATDRCEQIVSQ